MKRILALLLCLPWVALDAAPPPVTPSTSLPTIGDITRLVFPGPFANDAQAVGGGVGVGELYRKTGGTTSWRQVLFGDSVALLGDSMTAQNSVGLVQLRAIGYGTWARIFAGSTFDFEPNGSVLNFGTGGFRTDEVAATHLPQVLASAADIVVEASGFNDAAQAISTATVVANRRAMWTALRAAGKHPVACTTTPAPLSYTGNSGGAVSARIAAQNVAVRAAALADRVPLCDVSPLLETVPGSNNGIGDLQYFDGTLIHPNSHGAEIWGRALAAVLVANFNLTVTPLANVTYLTPNADFATGTTSPTNYNALPASNGSNGTLSVINYSGVKWWQIPMNKGTSTGVWIIANSASNVGGSPAGKTIDAVCQMRVVSGTLQGADFAVYTNPSVLGVVYDASIDAAALITPADGIVTFRTPKITLAGDRTQVWPQLVCYPVSGTCTIEVRVLAVRSYP
jgi:lysophospholipase L1-like esterase